MSTTLALVRELAGHGPLQSDRATVSPSRQRELASDYAAMPRRDTTGHAARAWSAMARESLSQLFTLARAGFTFEAVESDPYASAADMFADVESNRHIAVLATGSTGHHPYFLDTENDVFRAVHDVFGHYAAQRGFDRHGEESAYRRHALMFSPLAREALATETRGQNAALIATGAFPAERVSVLPARWRQTGSLAPTLGELDNSTIEAQAMHFTIFGKGF